MDSNRRNFLKKTSIAGVGLAFLPRISNAGIISTTPASGAQYMGDFAAPKLDKVRFAVIGVGARGSGHAAQIASIEGTEVVAISDLYEDLATKAANDCQEKGKGERHKDITLYTNGENDWR